MLGRPEVAGLRFAAGEPYGYHPRHLQHLGRCQVWREDRRVPAAAVGLGSREFHKGASEDADALREQGQLPEDAKSAHPEGVRARQRASS
jgi:hypothetical protein